MTTTIGLSLAALLLGSMFLTVPAPYAMPIIDAETGVPLSGLRVTADNGILCMSTGAGALLWDEWTLMNRRVTFTIEDAGHRDERTEISLAVRIGGRVVVPIRAMTATGIRKPRSSPK